MMVILAFDIGGTTVKYGVWSNRRMQDVGSFTTPKTWELMKEGLLNVKNQFVARYDLQGIAFSTPGMVDSETGIIHGISAINYIHHFLIKTELSKILALPISIANDANCAALAEAWQGAAQNISDALFVILGSGIGGAVIIDGKVHVGKHFFGGEFGIMQLEGGKTLSELGAPIKIAQNYCRHKNLDINTLTTKQIFELADENDSLAQEVIENFYHYLSQGLYNLQVAIDPERIIIGGSISANDTVVTTLHQRVKQMLFEAELSTINVDIRACQFRGDANLIGAVRQFMISKETD